MFEETDTNYGNEEKLNKFIQQKTSENEALQKLLDALNNESEKMKANEIKKKF